MLFLSTFRSSVAERISYLCLARKLIWPLWLSHIFTQWGWFVQFFPDDFPGQFKPAKLSLSQNLTSRTDGLSVLPFHSSRTITPWGKQSNLWTFESTLLDQRLPVQYKFDVFTPPLAGTLLCRLWHSATSFLFNLLGNFHSSLLQRRTANLWLATSFCSKISNTTFAMSTAKRNTLRQPATSILLIYFRDFCSSIQNLRDLQPLPERQMPAHPFYNCISSH